MNQRYFHFPLCALSFDDNVYDRLNCIMAFACVEMGRRLWQSFSLTERQARRSIQPDPELIDCGIDLMKDEQLQAVAGYEYFEIECSNIKWALADHVRLTRFIQEFERRHGTDARV